MRLSEVATGTDDRVNFDVRPNIGGRGVAIPDDPDGASIDGGRTTLNRRTGIGEVEIFSSVVETGRCSTGDAFAALVSGQC